jgi:hypothetical protein
MCLGLVMYFYIRTLSSLKAFKAYLLQDSKASRKSSYLLTILIPLPPPPDTAFINTGNSIFLA